MRRIRSISLFLLCFAFLAAAVAVAGAVAARTEVAAVEPPLSASGDCYLLSAAGHLKWMAEKVNDEKYSTTQDCHVFSPASFKLVSDISLSGEQWTPIGAYGYAYWNHGPRTARSAEFDVFDGNGHTISGLTITELPAKSKNENGGQLGLFGDISRGKVRNLTVEGTINTSGLAPLYNIFAGGISGRGGDFDHCISNVNVDVKTGNKAEDGKVTARYDVNAGGIVGSGIGVSWNSSAGHGDIQSCVATGTVTGSATGSANVGGIAGYSGNHTSRVTFSVYSGSGVSGGITSGGDEANIGGICGYSEYLIKGCVVTNADAVNSGSGNRGVIAGRERLTGYYDLDVTKEWTYNATCSASAVTVVGKGPDGNNLTGDNYIYRKTSPSELPAVAIFLDQPDSVEIANNAAKHTLTSLGVSVKAVYPTGGKLQAMGSTQIANNVTNTYFITNRHGGVRDTWKYFSAEPVSEDTKNAAGADGLANIFASTTIGHVANAYKKNVVGAVKDHYYMYLSFADDLVKIRKIEDVRQTMVFNGYNGLRILDFDLVRTVPAPTPTPEPVPIVVPPVNPPNNGWIASADEISDVSGVYTISTAAQLAGVAKIAQHDPNAFKGKTINLAKDIDLKGNRWMSIYGFAGTFDGKGHKITNMSCNADGDSHGLFNTVAKDATVKNLHLEGAISFDAEYPEPQFGGITGINNGTIQDSSFAGTLKGVVGKNGGDGTSAGGIAGNNCGIIKNCTVNIECTSSESAGGISCFNSEGTIDGCTANGTITIDVSGNSSGGLFGGVVGQNYGNSTVKDSNSYVNITITGECGLGGIAGLNSAEGASNLIEGCKSYGSLSAGSGSHVGGIAGKHSNDGGTAKINNCGWREGTAEKAVGGGDGAVTNTVAFKSGTSGDIVDVQSFTEETAATASTQITPTNTNVLAAAPTLLNISFVNPKSMDILDGITLDTDEEGNVVADIDAINANVGSDIDLVSSDLVALPLYIADITIRSSDFVNPDDVTSMDTALVVLKTTLNTYAGKNINDVVVMKVRKDNDIIRFTKAASALGITDGHYFIASDANGTAVTGKVEAGKEYYIFFGIKDNGKYDLDPELGNILDPVILGIKKSGGSGGSGSSGGCSSGLAALALFALTPVILRRKK